jgi:hypothetical protein
LITTPGSSKVNITGDKFIASYSVNHLSSQYLSSVLEGHTRHTLAQQQYLILKFKPGSAAFSVGVPNMAQLSQSTRTITQACNIPLPRAIKKTGVNATVKFDLANFSPWIFEIGRGSDVVVSDSIFHSIDLIRVDSRPGHKMLKRTLINCFDQFRFHPGMVAQSGER